LKPDESTSGASFPWFYPRTKEREPLTRNRARKIKYDLPAAVPASKGRAGRLAPLPAAPTAVQESGPSEQSEDDNERHPMNPVLELDMSGLGEGETRAFRLTLRDRMQESWHS
jgi:hypothetical protein